MKRQQDRDISPRNKRPRGSYVPSDHDISRNNPLTPDMDRRSSTLAVGTNNSGGSNNNSGTVGVSTKALSTGGGASTTLNRGGAAGKSYRTSYNDHNLDHSRKTSYRDDRLSGGGGASSSDYNVHHNLSSSSSRTTTAVDNRQPPPTSQGGGSSSSSTPLLDMYRSLCISNLNSKISEPVLIETLYREFERFGAFNIRMSYSGDQMVAYINFRYPEDARAARHDKSDLVLFDRQLRVEPVLNNKRRSVSPSGSDYVPRLGPLVGSGGGSGSDRFANRSSISPGQQQLPSLTGGPGRRTSRNMNPPRDISREREYLYSDSRHTNLDKTTPNHRHPSPETEEKATRTLFVGNLDHSVSENDLRRHFERFGVVEDVDIKRQLRGQGNSYAFVKFINLDCAHRAKVEMSGKHIGKFQIKIGYGKVTPTTCLWVGGLGPWINYQTLDREFDRFGAIKSIVWPHGKTYAYVLYDSKDAAQAAFQEMRRNPFGEKEFSLRVDFSDSTHIPCSPPPSLDEKYETADHVRTYSTVPYGDQRRSDGFVDPHSSNKVRTRDPWHPVESDPINVFRNPDNPRDFEHRGNRVDQAERSISLHGDRRKRGHSPVGEDFDNQKRYRSLSRERLTTYRNRDNDIRDHNNKLGIKMVQEQQQHHQQQQHQQQQHLSENFHEKDIRNMDGTKKARPPTEKELSVAEHVNNLVDLAKCLPVAWNGALILKNSAFLARMHVVSGDVTIVDTLMRDPTTTETSVLRITQRLRLDQPKLEEVGRRVSSSGSHGHCILLALPSTLPNYEVGQAQQRPLKNLVSYLKQKEAAGVISLPPNPSKDKENVGVLHAFPPCQFGYNFLLSCAPKLPAEPIKEDYLVVIVVRGAT